MLYNILLTVLSVIMFQGVVYHVIKYSMKGVPLFNLFCDSERKYNKGPLCYWTWIFHITNYYELLDALFLLVKKKNPNFLHVYHHASTLLITWLVLTSGTTFQWIAVMLNSFVHIFMYYYYVTVTLGYTLWWKKYLTSLQIYQFLLNMIMVLLWLFWNWYLPQGCSGHVMVTVAVFGINVSFFILFLNFFAHAYRIPPIPVVTYETLKA